MAMRGFGSRFLRMSSRHDHMKNALAGVLACRSPRQGRKLAQSFINPRNFLPVCTNYGMRFSGPIMGSGGENGGGVIDRG